MPFLGNKQEHKIKNLFRRHGINIRLYRRSATLANYLRPARETNLICSIPHCPIKKTNNGNTCFTKNCVYDLKCDRCNQHYIGYTTRHLHTRIQEHLLGRGSTITSHIATCSRGQITVSILSVEKDPTNARLAESIFIREYKPSLNRHDENILIVF